MFPNPHSPSRTPPSYRDAMYVPTRDVVGPLATAQAEQYKPITLRNWVVAVVVVTLLGLAIVIEISLAYSKANGGFPTPERKLFTSVSPAFFTAFFPTLLVAGLLIIWQSSDRSYRELQPYIVLARGNVTAAEGLLANYSGLSVWGVITNALKFRHYLILLSTVTTLLGSLLQPLAGSIIQIEQLPKTTNGVFIQSTSTIGLAPDIPDLNAFLAAAGFTQAAVFQGLPDPPFIHAGWSVAEFQLPSHAMLNGTMSVNTTAVQTIANCETPQSATLTAEGDDFTIQAWNAAGCTGTVMFDPDSSSTQYGVLAVENCGEDDIEFQPIMFWFFARTNDATSTPQGASIFCNPSINVFNVMAQTDLNNGSIIGVTTLDNVTTSNNVTGSPQNGRAFNSIKFPLSNDSFVQARAVSIGAGVSGAIFRFAAQLPGGVQSTFNDPNGFLGITQQVYTQHLAISAKSIYFVEALSTAPASIVSLVPRFVIDELPAHALSVALALIGFSALFLHIAHSRHRRRFFLAASPGSIAHIISMTAHARFGEKLYPYDDDETLARKLAGLSFSLDPRTGAVVADRDVGPLTAPPVVGTGITPYTLRDLGPRVGTSVLNGNTTVTGTYAEKSQISRSRSSLGHPVGGHQRVASSDSVSYAPSEDSITSGIATSFGEQELDAAGYLLPSYAVDVELQSSMGLAPPSVSEKRLRIDTMRSTALTQSQGAGTSESEPLLR
ncbi:hypothetical protein B0H12DRAFT_1228827 [Mycena haematopus]|nr:hypothetical protein B0H12DRAFT_1228827 [Mycena haematopus]